MGNLLPLVLAALLSLLSLQGGEGPPLSLPGVLAFLAAWYAAGRGLTGHLAAAALAPAAAPRAALLRFRRAVALQRLLVLPAHAALLWAGGWASLARDAAAAGGDLPGLAVAIAPFFLLAVLARAASHPAEVRLGFENLSLGKSLLQGARFGALVAVPLALFLGLAALGAVLVSLEVAPFPFLADLAARWDFLAGAFALLVLGAILAGFPVVAMAILGAKPMPPGPLRRRLEAYAARVDLGYRDLYVWDTKGAIPNAAVMGVGRRLRCVVFTDALLDRLDDE